MAKVQTIGIRFEGPVWHADGSGEPGFEAALTLLCSLFAVYILTDYDPVETAEWLGARGFSSRFDLGELRSAREEWSDQGILLITDRKFPALAVVGAGGTAFEAWPQALADLGAVAGPEIMRQAAALTAEPG